MSNETQVERLADTFAVILRAWLSKAQLETVKATNAEGRRIGATWCASHDFCDANQAMIDAWQQVTGQEIDLNDDATMATVDAAWNRAKSADFWIERYDAQWAAWADEDHLWQYGCRVCNARPPSVTDWSPYCHICGTHWREADKQDTNFQTG